MLPLIINGILVVILLVYVLCKKSIFSLLFSLYLYITLHYSYSALAIFSYKKFYVLRASTQLGAKLLGIIFIFIILGILYKRHGRQFFNSFNSGMNKWVGLSFLLWTLSALIFWIVKVNNGQYPNAMSIQNIFSTILLLILSLSFGVVIPLQINLLHEDLNKYCWIIFILTLFIVSIAAYEFLTLQTWGGLFKLESNKLVYRASSILFNPNLLGFWCAFTIVFAGLVFHLKLISKKLPVSIIVLSGLALFLSGSRSGLIFCLFCLGFGAILLLNRKTLTLIEIFSPLMLFLGTIITTVFFIKALSSQVALNPNWLNALILLTDRFVYMPLEIISYAVLKLSNHIGFLHNSNAFISSLIGEFGESLSKTTLISIQGRFSSELVDNGYLVMISDVGWLGLTIWIFFWIVFLYNGIKTLRISPGTKSAYSLTMVLGCALTAVFARSFQVFPFWILIAITLSLVLSWYNLVFEKDRSKKKY